MWEHHGKVRYYETDRMGVVHHSNYLRLTENARMDWIEEHVMSYSQMERDGVIVPCVSATGNFRNYLRFDDKYAISVRLTEYTGVRMRFDYVIRNKANDEICYTGSSEHCFTREGDYKPIAMRRKFPQVHEKMLGMLEK